MILLGIISVVIDPSCEVVSYEEFFDFVPYILIIKNKTYL
jgi:hypothetical protein